MSGRVHVVGAGLAGLSCALDLSGRGAAVTLHEATGRAGGRCRSWHDPLLDREIDNGSHLLLSGNYATLDYLRRSGAAAELVGPPEAALPFLDLGTGESWTLRPNAGRIPWWLLDGTRRVPGTGTGGHLAGLLRLKGAGKTRTVAGLLGGDPLYRRLWQPLAVSILNTPAEQASAALLWRTIAETLAAGGAACRPLVARQSLARTFVEPTLETLAGRGVAIGVHRRLQHLERDGGRVTALDFADGTVRLDAADRVVLALPPAAANDILGPGTAPTASHAIVNAHYRLDGPAALPGAWPLLGLVGGAAHWLFLRGDLLSVTVSAADALAGQDATAIATRLWRDAAAALGLDSDRVPPHRIIKERRATFAQTPEAVAARPGPRTALANLVLAGDWTDTGLPATIEGAIRSGQAAASAIDAV